VYTHLYGVAQCIHSGNGDDSVYTVDALTTIYVRIPRNRWTPIGEIDLWNGGVKVDPQIEERTRKFAALTKKIKDYEKQHGIRSRHDLSLAGNREHRHRIHELRVQRWEQSAYKYIQDELRPRQLKANKESRGRRAKDEALASMYEKLDGDRGGWYWQKPEVREAYMKLPLREAEEKMRLALQAKKAK
jgi:hypothetical protein